MSCRLRITDLHRVQPNCGERQNRENTTEGTNISRAQQSIPTEAASNEVLLEIFLHLDGAPADFFSVKSTCRRFAELIRNNEHVITLAWTKKQTGVKRILLENLHAQNCQQWTGIQRILEGHQRTVALVNVTDALEEMEILVDFASCLKLDRNKVDDLVRHRRRCMTILLGAEICALEPDPEGLTIAMRNERREKAGNWC